MCSWDTLEKELGSGLLGPVMQLFFDCYVLLGVYQGWPLSQCQGSEGAVTSSFSLRREARYPWSLAISASEGVLRVTEATWFLSSVLSGVTGHRAPLVRKHFRQDIVQWKIQWAFYFSFSFFQVTTDTEPQSLLNFLSESGKWIPR